MARKAYDIYARNLATTGVYGREPGLADAGLPPLYSTLLAAVYSLFGRHYLSVGLIHIFLDLLSIVLLNDICRRLLADRGDRVGALAALFFALYPYLIFQKSNAQRHGALDSAFASIRLAADRPAPTRKARTAGPGSWRWRRAPF